MMNIDGVIITSIVCDNTTGDVTINILNNGVAFDGYILINK